ncbi:MAG TPA: aldo/keto reductase [Azospirillaceae bacterium]|nr:aldo/keto reductase [Azospirillaceae bacterium]
MELRQLGRSGLRVPPLCFGGNVFGWTVDERASFALLDACMAAGLNFIDTADVYSSWAPGNSGGESETIIGRWLKARGGRDKVVIATKVGLEMGPGRKGLSRHWIRTAVEASLTRLQTDHIDLYQAHKDDPDTPQEETLAAFAELVEEGKVRTIGASNFSADRLASALALSAEAGLPRYESLQPRYNLYDRRDFEGDLRRLCIDHGLGVIGYASLGTGFLTGKYRAEADLGKSPRGARSVGRFMNPRGFRILAALEEVAGQLGAKPGQIALAWLMAQPAVTAPIASATSSAQLDELVAATRLKLDAASIRRLEAASAEV